MGLFAGLRSMLSSRTVVYVSEQSKGIVVNDLETAELYRT